MTNAPSDPAPRVVDADWADRAPIALGVIRDSVLVYVNERMADLLGGTSAALEGRPIYDYIADQDRERLRERHARRVRGERVPDSYEFTLKRLDGTTRLVEIFVTQGGSETVFQLIDRAQRSLHSRYLHALARLGASVQVHQSDKAVFAAMAEGLAGLGVTWVRLAPDGDGLRIVALGASTGAIERFEALAERQVVGALGTWAPNVLKAWQEGSTYIDDLPLAAARFFSDSSSKHAEEGARAANLTRAVVLRLDAAGEPAELLLVTAPWLLAEDLPAFSLFTAQVSAALDAARVISDLSSRNAELAALNRVASAAGAVHDLDSLFAVGARELLQVLKCRTIGIYLLEREGDLKLVYEHGIKSEARERYSKVTLDGPVGVFARTGKPSVLLGDSSPERRRAFDDHGVHSLALVPLLARSETIGVLTAGFPHVVSESELALMAATAAHFAAAVEAHRLFETLRSSYATLARTQQQMVHRERLAAIGELAAVVAHEVRNPLGVIFNSVGAIRRMLKDDPQARTIIDILDEEANRLNHIVGDLLDFARPATASLHDERVETILDAAAEAALGESHPRVVVVRDYDPGLPSLRVDARLIRQAFVNVVLNAVQSMPAGGRLTLRMKNDHKGVKVEIGDTGPGIPADVRPRIFEPFFTTRATGTGLGLAVVKRIVDGHRGEIDVTTTGESGTTFTLRLPLDPDEPASVDIARL